VIDVRAEVYLNGLVEAFGLAIHLGVEGSGYLRADAQKGEELLPGLKGEADVLVGDDVSGEAMMPRDLLRKNDCEIFRRLAFFGQREEVRHLGESVHNHPQLVASIREWQVSDEIHGDGLP